MRLPMSTRNPAPREPASLSVSSSPMRTLAENSSPSAMVHSASVAPGGERLSDDVAGDVGQIRERQAVPPTVMRSMRTVGIPTPTGTLWPSLPHMPTPSSSFRSLPTMLTYFMRLGTVADQRGVAHRARQFAVFDEIAFRSREDEVAAGDIHLAAGEIGAVEARGTERMMSSGSLSPASMKVLVMRGMGICS